MAEVSGIRNVILSLDVPNSRVKLMKILGQSPANSVIEYLPFERELSHSNDYGKMLAAGLAQYIKRANLRQAAFYLVLPDSAVSEWKLSMPALSRSKIDEALKSELAADLIEPKNFIVNTMQISQSKKTTVFLANAVRRDVMKEIKAALIPCGIDPRAITYTSAAVSNAVLFLRQRSRSGTYVLVDVREGETTVALVAKNRLIESTTLPFGYEMLRTDRFVEESALFRHDSATVVVMHAMETTTNTLKNKDGEFDDDVTYYDIDGMDKKQADDEIEEFSKQLDEAVGNMSMTDTDISARALADAEVEKKFDEATGDIPDADYIKASGAASSAADMSVTGSLTDTSTTIEAGSPKDMVERNFKTMYKHILLYCEAIKNDPDLPNPEHIIMNFPKRFAFLLARANKVRGTGYEFKYFNPAIENNARFTENLDMFGALLTKVYNKNRNF